MTDKQRLIEQYIAPYETAKRRHDRTGIAYTIIWVIVMLAVGYFSFIPSTRGVYWLMENGLPFYVSPELYGVLILCSLPLLVYLEYRQQYQYHAAIVFFSFLPYLCFTLLGFARGEIPGVPSFVYSGFLLTMVSIQSWRYGYLQ